MAPTPPTLVAPGEAVRSSTPVPEISAFAYVIRFWQAAGGDAFRPRDAARHLAYRARGR